MYKIIYGIVAAMIYKLVNEFFRAYIQYHLIIMQSFYLITNCLRKMGFS